MNEESKARLKSIGYNQAWGAVKAVDSLKTFLRAWKLREDNGEGGEEEVFETKMLAMLGAARVILVLCHQEIIEATRDTNAIMRTGEHV